MASDLWESERQRAALYVERRKRARAALRDAVFRRINAHVNSREHAHAQQRQDDERRRDAQEQEDDEQDQEMDVDFGLDSASDEREEALALDFLGDVDADDMRSLLVAHAPGDQRAEKNVTTSETMATVPPIVAMALAPLSMPTHLLSTASAASVMTTTMAGVAVGVSMGDEAGVSELMDELQIDVQSLAVSTSTTTTTTTTVTTASRSRESDGEEHKTEESTPPRHVQEQRVQRKSEEAVHGNGAAKRPIGGMLENARKAVFDPESAAANEMLTWVTGKNAPEVIKRLETLRGDKKRRVTKRFGTDTYLDQTSIRRAAKYHAGEGDGSSSSSDEVKSDSDFSPQEIIDVDEDEEDDEPFSETELLPDDLVDEDEEKRVRKQPTARRRIRQRPRTKMTIKKVATEGKTAKASKRGASIEHEARQEKLVVEEKLDQRPLERATEATMPEKRTEGVEERNLQDHEEPQTIDLQSESEAEAEPAEESDERSASKVKLTEAPEVIDGPTVEDKGTKVGIVAQPQSPLHDIEKLGEHSAAKEVDEPAHLQSSLHDVEIFSEDSATKKVDEPTSTTLPSPEPHSDKVTNASPAPELPDLMEDDGYGTDEIDEIDETAAEDAGESDGTIDLEDEDMLSQLDNEASNGSPSSTASGGENGRLNPVEPQVKMSPQQSTPSSHARALKPVSPSVKETDATEPMTTELEEVTSDVDFGSGESEDFGGDAVIEVSSDEEVEFGQFFQSDRKKLLTEPIQSETASQDAMPVKKVSVEASVSSSSSSVAVGESKPTKAAHVPLPTEKGSNGLRKVPNINTTTVAKGKYKQTRHAIRLLDHDMKVVDQEPIVHDPKKNLVARSRFLASTGPPPSGEVSPRTIRPLQLRLSSTDDKAETGGGRYLNYERTVAQPRPSKKEEFQNAAKQARERFDKRANGSSSTVTDVSRQLSQPVVTFEAAVIGTGAGVLKPLEGMMTSDGVFLTAREPQLDIYGATGAKSQFGDDDPLSLSLGHKRPVKYTKVVDEAKRQGIDVKKGKPEELDPKSKIPKKSKQQLALERASMIEKESAAEKRAKANLDNSTSPAKSKRAKTSKPADTKGHPSKYGPPSHSTSHDSKRAKASKSSAPSQQPSKYCPPGTASQHASRGRQEESQSSRSGSSSTSKKRPRSVSPPRTLHDRERERDRGGNREWSRGDRDGGRSRGHDRDRDRDRDEGRDRRRDRSRSPSGGRHRHRRSLSPSDRRSSHEHRSRSRKRSRSRSRSQSRSAPRNERRYSEERREDKMSQDEPRRSTQSYVAEVALSRTIEDDRDAANQAKQQPRATVVSSREVVKPGASASFEDDDGSDIAASDIEFVDDFDENPGGHPVFDICYNLERVKIDSSLRERMIYVCNLAPQVNEEQVVELFEQFGIAKNEEIGCPAVDVFLCQRSHYPRGDARITFTSPNAAALAVNELNAHIFGNSKLTVRTMDEHTMRVLHVQFDMFRDTWLCSDPNCRTETSYWTQRCGKCNRHRIFPSSNRKIYSGDWLCSICFATNARNSAKCTCCGSMVPPIYHGRDLPAQPRNSR